MNPSVLIEQAARDGVNLARSLSGNLKVTGGQSAIQRWLPTLTAHKSHILAELSGASGASRNANPPSIRGHVRLTERQLQAIERLREAPELPRAVVGGSCEDGYRIALAVRTPDGIACAELVIPHDKAQGGIAVMVALNAVQ